MATDFMPNSLHARNTRMAISPLRMEMYRKQLIENVEEVEWRRYGKWKPKQINRNMYGLKS